MRLLRSGKFRIAILKRLWVAFLTPALQVCINNGGTNQFIMFAGVQTFAAYRPRFRQIILQVQSLPYTSKFSNIVTYTDNTDYPTRLPVICGFDGLMWFDKLINGWAMWWANGGKS